jgi:2-amino-4-hydroxy-6-hydroxymethyldihydropteridine diphosphokinase
MTEVVFALGSNLGDRLGNLRAAVTLLAERGIAISRASSVWETEPVPADQPAFLNAVVLGKTELDAEEVLRIAKEVEYLLGRRPCRRWGPRPADIDILFFGDETIGTTRLTVPHPLIAERSFVLAPLAEVVRGSLPVLGATAIDLLERLGAEADDGMVRVGRLLEAQDEA